MKSDFFIDRPVFSWVISILIILIGIIGLISLPVEQYPNITPPVVRISASYSGANATTVAQSVATPIEQELNGTPGMLYMESTSSNSGSLSISVTFDVDVAPELAAVEVQNRIKLAESRLPSEVVQNGISVEKQASNQLLTIALVSDDPKFDEIYLSNYTTINVVDIIRRIKGIGRVSSVGSRYYGMQIWVYPDKMASFGLTVEDIQSALKDQNRESAAGEIGKQPLSDIDITIPITARGRLSSVAEFEDVIIKANSDGSFIRIRDVANVSLEAASYNTESGLNGKNAAIVTIYTLPGANAMQVAKEVKAAMNEIAADFPEGLDYLIPFDTTKYISESISEVYKTLFETLLLVILVVFLSLQNWRAAMIPIIAVPISIIGTFGVMLLLGFSINMLTLLGLVLSIGIIVDDAIVVVENVERIINRHKTGVREATYQAMKELSGALIATTLVLAAVFIPVSFLEGITGSLFRQFSITIVVSVCISTIVALTLSPAMCALTLKRSSGKRNRFFKRINIMLDKGNKLYQKSIRYTIERPKRIMLLYLLVILSIFVVDRFIPKGFVPQEDQGFFTVELELPEGSTLERTRTVTERAIEYLISHKAVDYVQNVTGSSPRLGTIQSRASLTVILKPWKDRNMKIDKVINDVKEEFYYYPEAKFNISKPPVVPGLGSAGGVEFYLQARAGAEYEKLLSAADTLITALNESKMVTGSSTSMQKMIPQLYFDVDKDQALSLGVPLSDVFSTMKAYLGSVYVNDFNMYNRTYKVYIQADQPFRTTSGNLNLFYVKTRDGEMVPLTVIGNTSYTTGPGNINRFNMFTSAPMHVSANTGYSSGQLMSLIEKEAKEILPSDIGIAWSGLSFQEKKSRGDTSSVMALIFLFVFLFLAAQYESWSVPVSALLSLPIAALGAYLGIIIIGLENDIYFKIGLVTLIGLAAKNAILIIEYAKIEVDNGTDEVSAAINAASLRFRPIIMTSMAFILGMLPMVLASGPGSASRHSIGTGVFFGMLAATTFGIILVPFFFVYVHRLKKRFKIPELNILRKIAEKREIRRSSKRGRIIKSGDKKGKIDSPEKEKRRKNSSDKEKRGKKSPDKKRKESSDSEA